MIDVWDMLAIFLLLISAAALFIADLAAKKKHIVSEKKPEHSGSRGHCVSSEQEGKTMQHKGTVRLETDRLILRRFRLDDSGAAFQNWTSDKRVTEFLRWPAHDTVNTTKKIIQMWVDGYARDDFYQWAIVLKNNGNGPIGTISVVDRNDALNILHIGYCIGSRWWNQGITSEAFSGIIPF